jgi:hypothetical protein
MDLAFAVFVACVIFLVFLVSGGQRVINRLVTGDWGVLPPCAKPMRREKSSPP